MKRRRLEFSDYYDELIVNEICEIYDVEKERMFLGSRQRNIIQAKRLYIYILREMFDMTLKNIGKVTNLHHASIIHHLEQFKFEYKNYKSEYEKLGVECSLLVGSLKSKDKKKVLESIKAGDSKIVIGTHALFQKDVAFKNLGLSIIDEQHRFGVNQRQMLLKKSSVPNLMAMTATPIPRTLSMTLYGDLDVSVIDELPPGRKEVKTIWKSDASRLSTIKFMRDQITKGRQIYVVFPLIDESEKLDYKDLMEGYNQIVREFPLPKYQVSVVHGQMKAEDKEYEMNRFVKGVTDIMVATTVIEVGVNVPNASVMIIESAERFGLSQLHQLRGRVGRGSEQSYCMLVSGNKVSVEAKKRLQTMVDTNDGFRISEVDLEIRGPGDMMGTKQSGVLDFKIANIVTDNKILQFARNEAKMLLEEDENLENADNINIARYYRPYARERNGWSRIS